MSATIIDFVRHGACEGGPMLRGRTDVELSAEGTRQIEAVLGWLPTPTHVISSPLKRCRRMGERLAETAGVKLNVDGRWAEMDFGDWDGRPVAELHEQDPDHLARFWAAPALAGPPGGETLSAFEQRVGEALKDRLMCHERHTVVMTHGGVIRAVLQQVLGMNHDAGAYVHRLDVPYASVTRVRVDHDEAGPTLRLLHHGVVQAPLALPDALDY
ncbi:histidine phosphatase family protein [Larsenimonas salina]|uniref:histidine phosphatase family protein n=1 Tax=Larsenimonas salina TaxID=1295565 RepID=UPI002072E970|nr:histidine phosphatase family protein [Larsenimonas salina]MCM5703639.1 histidine phosphatase family protein [Larsenimonas salina]